MAEAKKMLMKVQTSIHPSSVVEPGAQIGAGVRIGPFCHVGPNVVLGDGVELISHVSVMGATTIGDSTKVFPTATLGAPPQNAKHKGGRTTLVIGANCTIREGVTMHTGTDISRGETRVGDNGNFLAYTHVAHDCIVGNNVTFANGATLAGHCEIGDNVIIGGLTAVHQFSRVGDNAFLGGCSAITGDVIPFAIAAGNYAKLRGLNIVGLKRSGMSREEIQLLRRTYSTLFDRSRTVGENIDIAKVEFAASPTAMKIVNFIANRGKRPFIVPPLRDEGDDGADFEG
jgi:UDP-N-acetylglucosamine acyltransferase